MSLATIVLDSGAFIGYERDDRRVRSLVQLAVGGDVALVTSSAVVAQVWRDGARQVRLARLYNAGIIEEHALDQATARQIGTLCGRAGASDVVDGHVALLALQHDARVATSDSEDIRAFGVPAERLHRL